MKHPPRGVVVTDGLIHRFGHAVWRGEWKEGVLVSQLEACGPGAAKILNCTALSFSPTFVQATHFTT